MTTRLLTAVSLAAMASAAQLTLGELAKIQDVHNDLTVTPTLPTHVAGKSTTDNILNGNGVDKVFSGRLDTVKIIMVTIFFG